MDFVIKKFYNKYRIVHLIIKIIILESQLILKYSNV